MKKNKLEKISAILIFIIVIIISICTDFEKDNNSDNIISDIENSYEISNIPEFNGEISIKINNNIPKFNEEDMNLEKDYYSDLRNGKVRNGNDKD